MISGNHNSIIICHFLCCVHSVSVCMWKQNISEHLHVRYSLARLCLSHHCVCVCVYFPFCSFRYKQLHWLLQRNGERNIERNLFCASLRIGLNAAVQCRVEKEKKKNPARLTSGDLADFKNKRKVKGGAVYTVCFPCSSLAAEFP